MTIERQLDRWPSAAIGVVSTVKPRSPISNLKGGYKNFPEPVRELQEDEIWAVVPGTMGFVVFDVDCDHDLADKLLVAEFGKPAAKVKSHSKGYHYWYPASGEIGNSEWLCGDVRGTSGYIILWHSDKLLDQLEDHNCLRRLNLADIRGAKSLKSQPKTKTDTMLTMLVRMTMAFGLKSVWHFKQKRAMTVWRFGKIGRASRTSLR